MDFLNPAKAKDALVLGLQTYVPVNPCRYGHSLRYASNGQCVECLKEEDKTAKRRTARAEYDRRNYSKLRERMKRYERSPRGRIRAMVANAKARAKIAGVPFDITLDDIFIPEFCPVLGIRLIHGTNGPTFSSPTLDRLVPSRGYVRGNICVISHRANSIKNDATPAELRSIADWMERQCQD